MSRIAKYLAITLFILVCASCSQNEGAIASKDGSLASQYTVERQAALRESLPFEDKRDFDESSRGFIAAPDYRRIEDSSGNTVWDIG